MSNEQSYREFLRDSAFNIPLRLPATPLRNTSPDIDLIHAFNPTSRTGTNCSNVRSKQPVIYLTFRWDKITCVDCLANRPVPIIAIQYDNDSLPDRKNLFRKIEDSLNPILSDKRILSTTLTPKEGNTMQNEANTDYAAMQDEIDESGPVPTHEYYGHFLSSGPRDKFARRSNGHVPDLNSLPYCGQPDRGPYDADYICADPRAATCANCTNAVESMLELRQKECDEANVHYDAGYNAGYADGYTARHGKTDSSGPVPRKKENAAFLYEHPFGYPSALMNTMKKILAKWNKDGWSLVTTRDNGTQSTWLFFERDVTL